jgi:carboxyl-terminal processing protease
MESYEKVSPPENLNSNRGIRSSGRKALIIIVILSLSLGFGGGVLFIKHQQANSLPPTIQELINKELGQPSGVNFGLFWEVWNALERKYVDPGKIDVQKMIYGAIHGMVNSVGDPYTVFLEPKINEKFQEEISGAFGGVGIEIGKRDGFVTVISPLKDTPAYRAGIKAGDKIVNVDTKPVTELTIDQVVNEIRGKKGTPVILTIVREGVSGTTDYEVIRDAIRIPSVKLEILEENVAYLQVYTFNKNVDADFEKAAKEILKSNATKIIIDLRNNPGGLLDSAINLAGWFMEDGDIVTMEEFRDGTRHEFRSRGNGALKIYPTIVLINGGSASASEILAGAMHDNSGIQLVGEKSFGKGSVQELEEFNNGSSLKITIARWLTPKGRSITDLGIDPNVESLITDEDRKNKELELGVPGKDPQLDKAIELLR